MLKHRFFTLLFLFVLTTALLFSTAAAAPDGADGSTAVAPLTVPEEGYRHSGSAISGIDDTWLAEQKAALGLDPDSDAIYLHLEIPAEIGGQAIQSIAAKSFRDGTYQLVSADFTHASNLQSIGNQAFYTRSELGGTIDLSQTKLRSIADNYAFGGTGMTALILPETLSSIGSSAFYGCSKLASVTIPDGITSIGAHMFNGCPGTGVHRAPRLCHLYWGQCLCKQWSDFHRPARWAALHGHPASFRAPLPFPVQL